MRDCSAPDSVLGLGFNSAQDKMAPPSWRVWFSGRDRNGNSYKSDKCCIKEWTAAVAVWSRGDPAIGEIRKGFPEKITFKKRA